MRSRVPWYRDTPLLLALSSLAGFFGLCLYYL